MPEPLDEPATIGESEEGRPLGVFYLGPSDAPARVLVVSGQHGDEGRARRAVTDFLDASHRLDAPPARVAAVPNLNPDGAARKQRANAAGVDLNRDHQLLAAAETQALHRFVRTWRPHLIVDVHTYPARRARLLAHGLLHCHDVFLDADTFGSPARLRPILAELNAGGYRSGRYVLATTSGTVRHSTPDVADARNGLALRYGVPTLLVEGRKPVRGDPPADRDRLRAALRMAVEIAVRRAVEDPETSAGSWAAGGRVAIRSRRVRADGPCVLWVRDAASGTLREAVIPGRYYSGSTATRWVCLPAAYAVPATHTALIRVLRHHGFPTGLPPAGIGSVDEYRLRALPRRRPRVAGDPVAASGSLDGYVLFPVTPDGGRSLAVYLEPESKYGLHRYPELNLTPRPDTTYPVLRVNAPATGG